MPAESTQHLPARGWESRGDVESSPCGGNSLSGTGGVWDRGGTSSLGGAVTALPPPWAEDARSSAGALLSLWCRKAPVFPVPSTAALAASPRTHAVLAEEE